MKAKKLGIIGKKLGMTQLYHDGKLKAVTVIDFSDMKVLGERSPEKDGYSAVILGYDFKTVKRKDKTFSQAKFIREFRLDDTSVYGDDKFASTIGEVKKVDVSGIMKGRGFTSAIKRWNFHRGPQTHGSKTHRRVGSIGQCSFPARVFKGKKMPGHYGNTKVTTLSEKVLKVDTDKKLLFINGSVPGARNGYVMVRDAIKGKG